MGNKNTKKNLNRIYKYPLPLTISSNNDGLDLNLPILYPHNPISWVYWTAKLVFYNYWYNVPQNDDIVVNYSDGVFRIDDERSMRKVWRMGFFGKGVLSRSEPTWKERTMSRLNLTNSKSGMTMEELTKRRRLDRMEFKKKRQTLQDLELIKRKGLITDEQLKEMEELDSILVKLRKSSQVGNFDIEMDSDEEEDSIRQEDSDLINTNGEITQLEYVQLQYVEAFFLKFALNTVQIPTITSLHELFNICCRQNNAKSIDPDNKFVLDYVVYHYYRCLGWCVRSGIKFGTDFLLYKRGPPFIHAEFCLLVMDTKQNIDWYQMLTKARVVGGVKKTLVLVYVETPTVDEFNSVYDSNELNEGIKFKKLFELYKVSEVVYKRWNPSRTRD